MKILHALRRAAIFMVAFVISVTVTILSLAGKLLVWAGMLLNQPAKAWDSWCESRVMLDAIRRPDVYADAPIPSEHTAH